LHKELMKEISKRFGKPGILVLEKLREKNLGGL